MMTITPNGDQRCAELDDEHGGERTGRAGRDQRHAAGPGKRYRAASRSPCVDGAVEHVDHIE